MKQNFTVRQGALDGVEAFLSVSQHRNFRRAAAELRVTPSAVSQAVRALEARIGAAHHTFENAKEFATLCTRVPYIFRPFCASRRGPVWPVPSC
jgi:Bacterial regulatory helix-turn-helix protein, lysR family